MDRIQKALIKAGRKDLAQRYYMKISGEQFATLNDAQVYVSGLALGSTEIWYMRPDFFRDGSMGYEWLVKYKKLPDPKDLKKTHILLGKIKETDLDDIFANLQGHVWSPQGEARHLIISKGLKHTSMSMGDIIVIHGKAHLTDWVGFKQLN
jgi:hypothetical protein